jgi:hypothetical protein
MPENTNAIVQIPLDQILLNDTNPRGGINTEAVDILAANMATEGQKTDIKVRRLGEAERTTLPPDIPMPKGVELYRVVGGDHRVLAARKLGWPAIRATILAITPEQTFLEAYLDNQGKEMSWFAKYKAVEIAWAQRENPKVSQQAVADQLMIPPQYVSRALKLMPLLNTAARGAVHQNLMNSDKFKVTENPVFRLTNLVSGHPDDPDRVWAALKVVLDRKMTEPQVKHLVAWVKSGNSPETYAPTPKTQKLETPATHLSPEMADKLVELARQAKEEELKGTGDTTHRDALTTYLQNIKAVRSDEASNAKLGVKSEELGIKPHNISRREGLTILGQQIGKAFGWLTAKLTGHDKKSAQSAPVKWTEKIAKWTAKLFWHWSLKHLHHFFKGVANYAVPVRKFEHSGHGRGSSGATLPPLIPTVLHWAVYSFCQLAFWWTLMEYVSYHWMPSLRPWLEWPFRFLAHQVIVVLPDMAWSWGTSHLVPAAVVAGLLVLGIYYAYRAQPARMALLCALLFVGWYYGRAWSTQTPSLESAKVKSLNVSNIQTFTPSNFQTSSSSAATSVVSVPNLTPTAASTNSTPLPTSVIAASNVGGSSESASITSNSVQAADPPATSPQKAEISSSAEPQPAISHTSVGMTTPTPNPVASAAQTTPTPPNANGNNNGPSPSGTGLAQPKLGSQPVASTQVTPHDVVGQVAGSVAKGIGTNAVGGLAKKLFGL